MSHTPPSCTLVLTYFKTLSLDNLRAALHSVRRQALQPHVREIVVVDNDTADTQPEIQACINEENFPVPVRLRSFKHGEASRTHSWSTNVAMRESWSNWVFYTRADYVLDFTLLERCLNLVASRSTGWDAFITADCYQLAANIERCDATSWRTDGPSVLRTLPGAVAAHTAIDSGVWLTTRVAFERVGGLEESLTAWGHAQTHFQWKLHKAGTEIVRIPEVLCYHPQHGAPRDLAVANAQLAQHGIDIRELWARYEGEHIYR